MINLISFPVLCMSEVCLFLYSSKDVFTCSNLWHNITLSLRHSKVNHTGGALYRLSRLNKTPEIWVDSNVLSMTCLRMNFMMQYKSAPCTLEHTYDVTLTWYPMFIGCVHVYTVVADLDTPCHARSCLSFTFFQISYTCILSDDVVILHT